LPKKNLTKKLDSPKQKQNSIKKKSCKKNGSQKQNLIKKIKFDKKNGSPKKGKKTKF
jgi:hypothetical protein